MTELEQYRQEIDRIDGELVITEPKTKNSVRRVALSQQAVDMLVLPGGLGGVEVLQGDRHVQALIQHCYDEGRWLAAICAAPTILANLGFLDRRRAVCYPGMEELMGSAVVQKGAPVVADGHIITGEAAGSSFPFGLKLVEVLKGAEAARQVCHAVHYHG